MQKIGELKILSSREVNQCFVSLGFECLDRGLVNGEKCYDLAGKTGAKFARITSGWGRTEREPGVYDFAWLDRIVDALLAQGIQPWFNVAYGNPIYMPDAPNPTGAGCTPILYGEEVMGKWLDYLRALTKHYQGRISHYEMWNEANSRLFWYPGQAEPENMKEYAELVTRGGEAVRAVDPSAKIGAELDSRAFRDLKWCRVLFAALKPGTIDFYSFHGYQLHPEELYFPRVKALRQLLDENGHTHVEIWQGESGYPSWTQNIETHSMKPTSQYNEHRQAVGLLRKILLDLASGCKISSIYHMADTWEHSYVLPGFKQTRATAFGLLNGLTYTPKQTYACVSRLCTVLSGEIANVRHTTPQTETDILAPVTEWMRVSFERSGQPVYACYHPTSIEAEVPPLENQSFVVRVSQGEKPLEDPVFIDLLDGSVYAVETEITPQGDVIYSGIPACEYPCILCGRQTYTICPA